MGIKRERSEPHHQKDASRAMFSSRFEIKIPHASFIPIIRVLPFHPEKILPLKFFSCNIFSVLLLEWVYERTTQTDAR